MPWTAERSTINQKVQIGAESTSALGTPVAAGKLLECWDWTFGIAGDIAAYAATGHKYDSVQEENTEWVDLTIAGAMDYNALPYLLAGTNGAITPAAHGSSAVAKDWVSTPPTTGSVVPQTYTLQQGDSVRAHQTAYSLMNSFGYTITRKEAKLTAKGITQPISDGITLTSSPTPVVLAPVLGKQINIYLDTTSANLGVTQLLKVLQFDYSFDGVYGPFWPINRANVGYTAHVDLKPKTTCKLKLEADSVGMGLLTNLQVGSTQYLRVNCTGQVIDNNQTVALGTPSAGTFTLTYKGQTTSAIAYNATAATVQTALLALSTVGAGNATVSGSAGGPYTIGFIGTLVLDTTAMTGSGAGLTGGTFAITQTQIYQTIQHDMAVKVGKPSPYSDDAGIFAIEWELLVVEDPVWTKAQQITVTNLITAL
jgi:hypothetical protein